MVSFRLTSLMPAPSDGVMDVEVYGDGDVDVDGPETPTVNTASQPRLTLTSPLSQASATSLCTLSVSPGEYRLTIAASASVSGNTTLRSRLMSGGNRGGEVLG